MINISTGDTMSYGDPFYDKYSRKLGLMYSGLGGQLQGAKIDGVRYGDIMQYPEEIDFSEDSIYIPALGDTGSVKIVNTSDHSVRIDSINSVGAFYGYRGFLSKPGFEYPFYLFQTLPSPQWNDTLGIVIPPHDSINDERKHFEIAPPDPIEAIKFRMDQLGLKQSDIAEVIGGKNRASEILNRKRDLTAKMMRDLHKKYNIPAQS